MDSDSAARMPPPSIRVVHGPDGRLTDAAVAQLRSDGAHACVGQVRVAAPNARAERFADVARPLAPKRLRRRSRRSRVMVIDDEPMMCELVGFMLEPRFEVVTLASARTALEQLRAGAHFDIVLSDLMMPDVSGIDLFRTLSCEQPTLARRMIFMTGGTFTEVMQCFLAELGTEPLLKPFGREVVFDRIAAQLSTPG